MRTLGKGILGRLQWLYSEPLPLTMAVLSRLLAGRRQLVRVGRGHRGAESCQGTGLATGTGVPDLSGGLVRKMRLGSSGTGRRGRGVLV